MPDPPSNINPNIHGKKRPTLTMQEFVDGILKSDRYILGRAITLIESNAEKHREMAADILEACLPHSGNSIRIGITGVPGVGKSTFIEAIGQHIISQDHQLAVLAIDPTSQVSKGSIMGDKTRMETLSANEQAFIRPSAAGDSVGGVARKTRESIILCEAAGYDVIFVETVGVGQSETAVHSMVDFFLLLVLAGAGDELQGMKRGIMEMADAIVVNKADGDNKQAAEQARMDYKRALHLYPPKASEWQPPALTCSAITGMHIELIWEQVLEFQALAQKNGYLQANRKEQNKKWMHETLNQLVQQSLYGNEELKRSIETSEEQVARGQLTPTVAARNIFSKWLEGLNKENQ